MNIFQQRQKLITLAVLIIVSLFLLGLTKLPWIISKPLMVNENIKKAPVIVVLYCGYGDKIKNGLNQYSLYRVQKGVKLWENGLAPYLLFSGGSSDRNDNNFVGSERMALEAERLNVPKERIIVETKSKDTRHNILNTTAILNKNEWESLILVTDDYHLKRAMTLFNKKGLKVFPAPVEWKDKGTWKTNWTYLRFLRYELQARAAYLVLNDNQIDMLVDFLRPG